MISGGHTAAAAFLDGFARIDARGIPCRRAAGQKPGQRGGGQGKQENRNVQPQIRFIGQRAPRHHRDQSLQHGVSDAHAQQASGKGHHQALSQQLREDRGPRRSQGAAHGQLLLPGHAARQQQIGHVDAGNEQHKADGAEQQPEHLDSFRGQEIVVQRLDFGAPALVAPGVDLRDMRRHRIHILPRLLERDAGLHAAHDQQPVKVVVQLFRLEDQGHGQLVLPAIRVARGLHADYCIRLVIEA